MKKINVADITLKKLSEEREISLLFREKSAIANCADQLGVDVVELPAVKTASDYLIPALFGSLTLGLFASTSSGKKVVKNGWLIFIFIVL